ncbi:hypothetical protein PPOP_2975 [Paenibacillus popilliae ATCC 14706]|uniref:Uncharacterized protein n=1 Tax=Paenibacillus popilliae ATCC 14706 TaxID=1212764 RepID=M9M3J5_PAEPP|nr:hypothetical protein PPOP_2975 [Paenibacillus popilliae ATCC 14706]
MHDGVKVRCLTAWLIPNNVQCDGAGDRSRTHDLLITSQPLYQLSYTGLDEWWTLTGSNRRPSACKADALPAELSVHKVVTRTGFEPVLPP